MTTLSDLSKIQGMKIPNYTQVEIRAKLSKKDLLEFLIGVYGDDILIDRTKLTDKLSKLVEKRLTSQHMYWSAEVDFDKNTDDNRRIDYVGFKAYTPDYIATPVSVEKGTFACYEVKSCWDDFQSGHGLSFYGDENYLVCSKELAEEIIAKQAIDRRNLNGILVPNKSGTALYQKYELKNIYLTARTRNASEMLWAIVQAHQRPRRAEE